MSEGAGQLGAASVPRLGRGVRLQHDQVRGVWLLLAPERMLELDDISHAIVSRIDGEASLGAIADDLARTFAADRDVILADVTELVGELTAKRIIVV